MLYKPKYFCSICTKNTKTMFYKDMLQTKKNSPKPNFLVQLKHFLL